MQGVAGTHASEELLQTKAGPLQAQRVWFTSKLLELYSSVVGHVRQARSPVIEKLPAPQPAPQTALIVGKQAAAVTAPAHEVQLEQGATPEAL